MKGNGNTHIPYRIITNIPRKKIPDILADKKNNKKYHLNWLGRKINEDFGDNLDGRVSGVKSF
jgi:hypothetical protein